MEIIDFFSKEKKIVPNKKYEALLEYLKSIESELLDYVISVKLKKGYIETINSDDIELCDILTIKFYIDKHIDDVIMNTENDFSDS